MEAFEEKILTVLKEGCSVQPGEEFKERSRATILAAHQTPSMFHTFRRELIEHLTFSMALGMASITLLIIFGGFSYWDTLFPGASPSLSSQELTREAENLDFKIELKEAKYLNTSAQQIGALLNEIDEDSTQTQTTDDLLDKAVF